MGRERVRVIVVLVGVDFVVTGIGSGGTGGGASRQQSARGRDGVSRLDCGGCWTLASVPGLWHGFVVLVWLLLEGRRCLMKGNELAKGALFFKPGGKTGPTLESVKK